ncbi:MAG: type II toxin-antitoxin system VapC family toxin [Pirellulaceae bacterium]|nr:type II toxin-antitoxin system VapC family toxin [Planctomycetales bacterium]
MSRSKNSSSLVRGYSELAGVITTFARAQVLAFSDAAAEVYDELKAQKVRVGTMDLRIASIVIANQMTLLTKNTVDFSRIPNFTFADWTIV